MLMATNTNGVGLSSPTTTFMVVADDDSSPLDFTLIDPQENKSMMGLLNSAAASLVVAESPPPPPPLTSHHHLDDESDSSYSAKCAFCKKTALQDHFKGRFCSKICVGRFAQRTRLMRKQNEKTTSLAATATAQKNNVSSELKMPILTGSSVVYHRPLVDRVNHLEDHNPTSINRLYDNHNDDDDGLKMSEEASKPLNEFEDVIAITPSPSSSSEFAVKQEAEDRCSALITNNSDDMEIEIFKPTIDYSNIADGEENKFVFDNHQILPPSATSSFISSSTSAALSSESKVENLNNNGFRTSSYSLRAPKPKKNYILDLLQSEYEIKSEEATGLRLKKEAKNKPLTPDTSNITNRSQLLSSFPSQPQNQSASSSQHPTLKLKRGRPSKKLVNDLAVADAQQKLGSGVVKQRRRRVKHLSKLKENIRESVYLTRVYTSSTSFYETIGFKIDSRLAGEFNHSSEKSLRFWSVDEVSDFVASIPGCEKFVKLFVSQEIDGEALVLIKLDDLIKLMQIQLGPALKIFNYISKLKFLTNTTIV